MLFRFSYDFFSGQIIVHLIIYILFSNLNNQVLNLLFHSCHIVLLIDLCFAYLHSKKFPISILVHPCLTIFFTARILICILWWCEYFFLMNFPIHLILNLLFFFKFFIWCILWNKFFVKNYIITDYFYIIIILLFSTYFFNVGM